MQFLGRGLAWAGFAAVVAVAPRLPAIVNKGRLPAMALGPEFTSMNVSLPKEQKAYVDQRVQTGGFGSASDYVRELICRDQRKRPTAAAAADGLRA